MYVVEKNYTVVEINFDECMKFSMKRFIGEDRSFITIYSETILTDVLYSIDGNK